MLNTGLDASKEVVHETGEYLGNEIADTVTESDNIDKQEPIEAVIIPPGKGEEILNKLTKVL